ncbi:MAG: SDR family oxidoreductase [Holophagae bacterium]|jgi:NAD(P)-dependent dehydrogenase (short-subunit alcohol dehydrogenase family)
MDITSYLPSDLFAGQVAFITGGGSGINLGIAKAFAELGADVGICGRSAERLEGAAAELGGLGATVVAEAADVRDYEALQAALESTRSKLGPVNHLVCGAAGNFPCPAEELSPGGFKAVVDIDLLGSFNACRAAFDQLKDTRGTVLFISAGMSFMPYALQAHVGAAKAGIDQLMRNLALEWGRFGIRSNSVAPGPIKDTEGMQRLGGGGDDVQRKFLSAIPLGRMGDVGDIANAAVFLASPLASYITGTLLIVDGGQNLPGSAPMAQAIAAAVKG